jgi:MFS family permease
MTLESYREIFRTVAFRRFWIGFTLSVTGDALTRVALTWLVYELTGSAAALGWLMVCFTGPIVVGGLLAGWLLDRFDRRLVMIVDNSIRGGAMAIIPILAATGQLALWHLYTVAAVYGLLMMIALAGGPTIMPSLVAPRLLTAANALEMLSFTLGGVIGPLAAGLLIPRIGAPNVMIVDALSYAVFALMLARIRAVHAAPANSIGGAARAHLGHAVRLLLHQPVLLATTLMFLTFNIGAGLLAVCLPILVDQRLGGGSQLYGTLLGLLAGGEVIGAVLAGQLRLRCSYGVRICIAQMLAGVALGLVLGGAVWSIALGLALFGLASAPLTIWAQTLRMRVIPDRLRGRSFALLRMLMQSGNPIGGVLGALLLPLAGVAAAIWASALLVGLPGLLGAQVAALRTDRLEPPAGGAEAIGSSEISGSGAL